MGKSVRTALYALPRYVLGSIMALALTYKIVNFGGFSQVVRSVWPLSAISDWAGAAVAGVIAGLEAVVVVMLLRKRSALEGGLLATGLLVVFTVVTLLNYTRISGNCGCMWSMAGIIPASGWALVARNIVLILLASTVAWISRTRPKTSEWGEVPPEGAR
jgi:hypothetical protein